MVKTSKFDAADYLDSPETIAAYLTEAFDTNDPAFISLAIGTVAKAKGMAHVAGETGFDQSLGPLMNEPLVVAMNEEETHVGRRAFDEMIRAVIPDRRHGSATP